MFLTKHRIFVFAHSVFPIKWTITYIIEKYSKIILNFFFEKKKNWNKFIEKIEFKNI